MKKDNDLSRRKFVKKVSSTAAGAMILPTIVPSSVFGKNAPSNRINIGMVGTGRQAIRVNLKKGFLNLDNCRVVSVCDVDKWRMAQAEKTINEAYSSAGKSYKGVKKFDDYRDLVRDKDVDAIMISTTDHWHAPQTIAAAFEGKHVCMEKAFSIAPMHAKATIEAVKQAGVSNRLDSEFRSMHVFQQAVELVHNKQVGKIKEVQVGVPPTLNGSAVGPQETTRVPDELNYDMWLGPAFEAPYTVKRVHDPQIMNSRPGWMRISDYCNGMITNWGAHLIGIALWGIKKEYEHPVSVEGTGTFDKGLWNTINAFDLYYEFADGLKIHYKIDAPYVKFIGENGWVKAEFKDKLTTSDDSILNFKAGKNDVSYADVLTDKADFLKSIEMGKPSMEPLEVGYNVYLITHMGLTATKLGRKLNWDQKKGRFILDNAANAMLTKPFRRKWIDKKVADWMDKYQEYDM
jgi:myo-inositol 2-dehydrogenase / D-chiro-inositol 1-dehydrogenase